MVLRSRTRLLLRRSVVAAALGALFMPAVAGAKAKTPVVTKVTPRTANVGNKLTLTGKHFKRGKAKNSVLFKRDKGKALFVKADVSTTKKLTVIVPKKLEKYMLTKGNTPLPTRFRLRVLAAKLSKNYTSDKLSPVIGPEKVSTDGNSGGAGVPTAPDGDCDADGVKNGVDADDDNDLLADSLELALLLDPCVTDTDADGVEDGFEYQSAIDLNNDNYQTPNTSLPYPGKTPYANPLFTDAGVDYDGDGLTLSTEYRLWKYTYEVNHTSTRTLSPLSYTDGAQFSFSTVANGRRTPTMATNDYQPPQTFRNWAVVTGYAVVTFRDLSTGDLFDVDRSGGAPTSTPTGFQETSELQYWDLRPNGWVSDDERDEDADGLTNYDEAIGPLSGQDWWTACYTAEGKFPIQYAGTKAFDGDSDGDGILDGADDQDFDDIPNLMERSRNMAGNTPVQKGCGATPAAESAGPAKTWVNPFNPCLPDPGSVTCPAHPEIAVAYPPFQDQWKKYVLK
jgi:hypothetical protein